MPIFAMDSSSEFILPVPDDHEQLAHAGLESDSAIASLTSSRKLDLPRLLIPPHNHELYSHQSFANDSPVAACLPAHLEAMWHYECVVSPRSPASPSPASRSSSFNYTKSPLTKSPLLSPAAVTLTSPRHTRFNENNAFNTLIKSPRIGHSPKLSSPGSSRSSPGVPPPGRSRLAERVFSTFDLDGDGRVTAEELCGIFRKLGISEDVTKRSAPANIESDDDDDVSVIEALGHVDWEEFLELCRQVGDLDGAAASGGASDVANPDLLAAFHVFDKDRNGFISPEELQSVLCSLGFSEHASSLEACVDMIARVDENGDGQIDFFEFEKMMGSSSTLIITSTC